jgi:hypothetical protein
MSQYNFGIGSLTFIPSGANPTPVPVGVLTDVSVDVSYDLKELRGSYQAAVDVARGPLKITGKAKNAAISGAALLAALGGATSTTGSKIGITGEAGVIPAAPYEVTVAQGATFYENLGVIDLTAGKQLTCVAAAPAAGQYMVNSTTGKYTFAAADTGHNVSFNYAYTAAAVGKTVSLLNQVMGASTSFILACYNNYNGKGFGWRFPAVHVPKLSLALKAEAYTDEDMDFFVVQDPTSLKIVDFYTNE